MKTAIKNIILATVIFTYLFGVSGFTVHHCCCKKVFHTTCAILNAYNPYKIIECENHKEAADKTHPVKISKQRCCKDFVYSLDGEKWSNEDNLNAPEYFQVELFTLLADNSDNTKTYSFSERAHIFDESLHRLRHIHSLDILCSFRI